MRQVSCSGMRLGEADSHVSSAGWGELGIHVGRHVGTRLVNMS